MVLEIVNTLKVDIGVIPTLLWQWTVLDSGQLLSWILCSFPVCDSYYMTTSERKTCPVAVLFYIWKNGVTVKSLRAVTVRLTHSQIFSLFIHAKRRRPFMQSVLPAPYFTPAVPVGAEPKTNISLFIFCISFTKWFSLPLPQLEEFVFFAVFNTNINF